jgi:hypothetical protein
MTPTNPQGGASESADDRTNKLEREKQDLLKAVTALWHALGYFAVTELDAKPNAFHDLIDLADELCRPFRKARAETGEGGR